MTSGATAAVIAGAGGPVRPPAQVLSELLEAFSTLLNVEVALANQAQHKVDIAKLRDEIAQAKEQLNAKKMLGWRQNEPPWTLSHSRFKQKISG